MSKNYYNIFQRIKNRGDKFLGGVTSMSPPVVTYVSLRILKIFEKNARVYARICARARDPVSCIGSMLKCIHWYRTGDQGSVGIVTLLSSDTLVALAKLERYCLARYDSEV